jgi:hypothetical protein
MELAPDLVEDAEERLGVVFDEEDLDGGVGEDRADRAEPGVPQDDRGATDGEDMPGTADDARGFAEDVEAEVAELLGEVPAADGDPESDGRTTEG